MRSSSSQARYFFLATLRDFFGAAFRKAALMETDGFDWLGVLMILRTAFTRSELSPRISPISSGVGTELPMMWVITLRL